MGDYASCNKAFGINPISIDKNETCEYNKSKKILLFEMEVLTC